MNMRTKIIGTFPALLCAAIILTAWSAEARAPRSREMTAVIQTINYDQRTVLLNGAAIRGPRELVWNSRTRFVHDWKFVPATALKSGMQARVFYRSPFFGKPFITKVVWENGN